MDYIADILNYMSERNTNDKSIILSNIAATSLIVMNMLGLPMAMLQLLFIAIVSSLFVCIYKSGTSFHEIKLKSTLTILNFVIVLFLIF